ncbi:hypothetical protein [Pseudomonas putida]|uniref:Uncharacterized protein n=1 Tax=Pseudomonas putida TaxID=303 RepID=A0A7V8EK92_PSEPU|nr:hypothetical protein [Pseudomonas putida]KAF0255742.1 hypothetical protein GN299_06535 [Pseudomonas putida]
MTIQTTPKSATLAWDGLRKLPIPSEVVLAADKPEVHVSKEGISGLPAPFNRASIWVSCREVWPHNDPDFEGLIFITITVQGDHRYSQLMPNHTHTERGVFPGTVFTTDPMALHWLAPNSDHGAGFIGLQFEVPHAEADSFYVELLEQLSAVGKVRELPPSYCDSLLVATDEYKGLPPGPLAEHHEAQPMPQAQEN